MAVITARITRVDGVERTEDNINAAILRAMSEETLQRVRRRVDHPAADTLRTKGINQYVFTITGPRGGPGVIRPVRKKALWWPGAPHPFAKVNGAGLRPLIEAEARRIDFLGVDEIV